MTIRGEFSESSAQPRTRSIPLSHLSVELGHLYLEDLLAGPDRLAAMFAEAEPWYRAAVATVRTGGKQPRVSTCFLIDDYFSQLGSPRDIVPQLIDAAESAGLTIDYLARESCCALTPGAEGAVSPAELIIGRLVDEPPTEANGGRPPATRSGWLSNGRLAPTTTMVDAMDVPGPWRPREQTAARGHSIIVDVELWDDDGDRRVYSCSMLAAVWQLLRLGLIRVEGQPIAQPVDRGATWPASWADLPSVTRLNPRATPFCAYTSTSILSPRFMVVEVAVRTILGQVWSDPEVTDQIANRAVQEGFPLPVEVLDRIESVLTGSGLNDPS